MYDENNGNFALKDLIIKILFLVIIIFIIVWLFPTKEYVNQLVSEKTGVTENQIFNENIQTIKTAALGYYNGDRLPETKEKITLKELLDKNLLTEIEDSQGNKCDTKKSYVEITNEEEDYKIKVNLVCKNKEAYVISYLNANDSCTDSVCEKKKLTENEKTEEKENQTEENKDQTENKENAVQKTECQYAKTTGGYWSNYSNWSNWQTTKIEKTNSREVQTKQEKVKIGTKTNTKEETKQEKPKKLTYNNGSVVYECSNEYDNAGRYTTATYCIKTIKTTEKVPVYQEVTYYRYRDRKYINQNTTYKWSNCNDKQLLNSGYKKTSKTR